MCVREWIKVETLCLSNYSETQYSASLSHRLFPGRWLVSAIPHLILPSMLPEAIKSICASCFKQEMAGFVPLRDKPPRIVLCWFSDSCSCEPSSSVLDLYCFCQLILHTVFVSLSYVSLSYILYFRITIPPCLPSMECAFLFLLLVVFLCTFSIIPVLF